MWLHAAKAQSKNYMVFKRPTNSRDDKNGRSSNRDEKPKRTSSSTRGGFSKSTDKSNNTDSKKRYSSGPAAERSSFSSSGEKKSFGPRKPYSGRPTGDGESKSFEKKKPYSGRSTDSGDASRKPYGTRSDRNSDERPKRSFGADKGEKKRFETSYEKKPARAGGSEDRPKRGGFESRGGKKFDNGASRSFKRDGEKPFRKPRPESNEFEQEFSAPVRTMRSKKAPAAPKEKESGLIRLNRYIANAGICSRRKADELIEAGVVSVNGEVVSELGYKVDPAKDEIRYNGEMLRREKNVYVLLNKPKDYITTTDDPQERRTVMHLVEKDSRERIYPVGRLDRNTTGLLLMTNDGDLADKLSHPRGNVTKLYHVELNKSLTQGDLNKIGFGVELEDGVIKPDSVSYVSGGSKREIGIQIHSGKNRIVRRIFEHLGYEVVKLDRVVYANLTKKDLPRGRWRYLDEKEIIQLKHLIK